MEATLEVTDVCEGGSYGLYHESFAGPLAAMPHRSRLPWPAQTSAPLRWELWRIIRCRGMLVFATWLWQLLQSTCRWLVTPSGGVLCCRI